MTATLHLPFVLRAQILREAADALPRECCGLLEGTCGAAAIQVTALHPAHNLSADPDRFEIDPADHFAALRAARGRGHDIVGCYHSHPGGAAVPSDRDRKGAGESGFVWVIVAPTASAQGELSAFVFDGQDFTSLPIAVR